MDPREERVIAYLNSHPKFLEDYVTGPNVSNEVFHRWCARRSMKIKRESAKEMSGPWMADDLSEFQNLLLSSTDNMALILYELGYACAQMVHTEMFDVLVYKQKDTYLINRIGSDGTHRVQLKKITRPKRTAVYTHKVLGYSGILLGEIHFYRSLTHREQIAVNILCTWGSALIHHAQLLSNESDDDGLNYDSEQRKLGAFLLDVDIVSMDTVIMKVMNFAQKLTNADRASLFLMDHKTNELYARIFDIGTRDQERIKISEDQNKEIRFPANKGIGGYVASTGQVLNIEDAYEDPRFNKEVDQITGYHTRNILCMPIFIRGSVIGVVQMVNKADGPFTKQDENSFETFAVYCGLALHHAKLYDRIKRSEQKYRVALELLAYHSVCSKDEVTKLKSVKIKKHIPELDSFEFNVLQLTELEKPVYAVYMFRKLFEGKFSYEKDDLVRFVLTVRKNYRQVAYHNWAHGWSVAHAMFALLRATTVFTQKESLALYVACLCHDLDHRGKNNAYMKSMSTPLAAIYSTSVMEHHHFNQTVTILQQDGHNIFKSFSSEEYKEILGLIKHCILATDLAVFFGNKAKLKAILDDNAFDWENTEHRRLMEAILMTGCDLIAATKPWTIQTETVKIIFEEFYEQGDAERKNGREPIAMMDREKADELPQMQVGFMQSICLPCYELIAAVIPESQSLLDRCQYNAKKWQELADEQKKADPEEDAS